MNYDPDSPTRRLARFASALDYSDVPTAAMTTVKRMLLDTLGTALAATTLGAGCREVAAVILAAGGRPESTLLGTTQKVPAAQAAFVNGALAHALNFDPIGPEVGHVGVVCLAAPLAAAEARGGVSGREFLTAVAVATEVNARVTAAVARAGRHPSAQVLDGQVLAYFGAAAGAGRALQLSADQMESAFGLALMQAAGSMQIVLSGDPPAKAIYGAFPNQAGVLAAQLSKAGLAAQCAALEGSAGLYGLFYQGGYDAAALRDGIGVEFLLSGTQFKPWPTSGIVHPFIEAAGRIHADGARSGDITAIEITGPGHIQAWCEPLAERRRPRNAAAAANSIPFAVGKALCRGDIGLQDFTAAGLSAEPALALADKLSYALDDNIEGGRVVVTLRNGQQRMAHVGVELGHPSRPVPDARLISKFRDCCHHAARPLSSQRVDDLIALVANLEALDDVSELAWLAAGDAVTG